MGDRQGIGRVTRSFFFGKARLVTRRDVRCLFDVLGGDLVAKGKQRLCIGLQRFTDTRIAKQDAFNISDVPYFCQLRIITFLASQRFPNERKTRFLTPSNLSETHEGTCSWILRCEWISTILRTQLFTPNWTAFCSRVLVLLCFDGDHSYLSGRGQHILLSLTAVKQ